MDEEHRCDSRLPLFVDASASIGPDNVAGLDDQQQRNRAGDRRPLGHRDAEQSGGAEARDPSGRAPREAAVPLSPFRGTPSHSDLSPPLRGIRDVAAADSRAAGRDPSGALALRATSDVPRAGRESERSGRRSEPTPHLAAECVAMWRLQLGEVRAG